MRHSLKALTFLFSTTLFACTEEPSADASSPQDLPEIDEGIAGEVEETTVETSGELDRDEPAGDPEIDADADLEFNALIDEAVAGVPSDNPESAGYRLVTPLYDLPLFANDLADNERYYTRDHAQDFSQKFGYDITVRKQKEDGTWTSVKDGVTDYANNPRNIDSLAWGRNIYAMADGVVVGCWRNALANPRPKKASEDSDVIPFEDREWLHQDYRDGLVGGGGNYLYVLHDDGTYGLYAHAQPGSIPASLCPNNAIRHTEPIANTPKNEHCIREATAVANGARITKGQLLGRIGNSGNSTGPHLHIHVAQRDEARSCDSSFVLEGVPLKFSRGMSTPYSNGNADIDDWTSFSGQSIPTGEVLFWPPTRLTGEVARHGFKPEGFSRLFAHLANSGFKPVLFDGYTVGTDTRYNFVWRPADRSWRMRRGMSLATMNSEISDQAADGFEPVWAESYTTSSGIRYAAIFEYGTPGTSLIKTNLTTAQHDDWFATATSQGLKPTTISVVSSGGQVRYTDLYRSNSIGSWILRSQVDAADYQDLYNAQTAAGRWPIYANAYIHNGTSRFSVVFASSGGPAAAGHGLTSSGYQDMWEDQIAHGRQTRVVTGYDGAQVLHRFLGVWK
jgi:murein DD-endopeptidase MepM/ murein hydrolase activator NlpD